MDLSNIKLVVSDMDGTLLNSNHEVSYRFFELFEELQQRNIGFVAASGRQYNSIVDKLHPIKDNITIIAENGAFVKQRDKELLVTPLHQQWIADLLDLTEGIAGAHAMLCGKYNAYFDGKSRPFLEMLQEYYSGYEIVDDLHKVDDEIVKIAMFHSESSEAHIYPKVSHWEDRLKVKISGQHWVDLNHIDAHKGFALEWLQHRLGITPAETLVFGDYNNDLEMLQCADYSFAMANAHPKVKETANYQTLSNDENGVEYILEKVLS